MASKVKTAFLLAGGCAGCEMSVVDLSEALVDVLEALEIVFKWAGLLGELFGMDEYKAPEQWHRQGHCTAPGARAQTGNQTRVSR